MAQPPNMRVEGWANQILYDVNKVPIPKQCVPGTIVVDGSRAKPIVTDYDGQVLIAAAELGQGRLVVFPHDIYGHLDKVKSEVPEFAQLFTNIKQWVTRGKFKNNSQIVEAEKISKIPEDAVLIWGWGGVGPTWDPPRTLYLDILEFLVGGGAMIAVMTPWGCLQLRPDLSLDTIPMNKFIKYAGMHFTDKYLSTEVLEKMITVNKSIKNAGMLH